MPDPAFNTVVLQACLDRMRAASARPPNELLRAVQNRLQKLAARMIRGFPERPRRRRHRRRAAEQRDPLAAHAAHAPPAHAARLLQPGRRPHPPRTDRPRPAARKGKQTVPLNPAGSSDAPRPHEPVAPDVVRHRSTGCASTRRWTNSRSRSARWSGLVFYHGWTQAPDRRAVPGGRTDDPPPLGVGVSEDPRELPARTSRASEPLAQSASTRRSPSRRVTPTRSRYSHIGTANLRVVPSRSRISATVAPGPGLQPLASLAAASRASASRVQVDVVGHLARATPRRPRPRRCP